MYNFSWFCFDQHSWLINWLITFILLILDLVIPVKPSLLFVCWVYKPWYLFKLQDALRLILHGLLSTLLIAEASLVSNQHYNVFVILVILSPQPFRGHQLIKLMDILCTTNEDSIWLLYINSLALLVPREVLELKEKVAVSVMLYPILILLEKCRLW